MTKIMTYKVKRRNDLQNQRNLPNEFVRFVKINFEISTCVIVSVLINNLIN